MRLGIFGGTFDPPHLAHLVLAMEAADQLGLEKVLWVLTPDPPHKQERIISPVSHRLTMVSSTIAENPIFELSLVDIDRPGPHYAVDTVKLLGRQYPGFELYYLIGGDSLRDLPAWRDPKVLIDRCDGLGVMRRPGVELHLQELEHKLPGLKGKLVFFDAPLLDISSQDIRDRVASGRPYRYFVLPGIYHYIEENLLYR